MKYQYGLPTNLHSFGDVENYCRIFGYHVHAYTDGAFRKKGKLGGWAFNVHDVVNPSLKRIEYGHIEDTTTQRMEIMAILKLLQASCEMHYNMLIISDSRYCVDAINDWIPKWKKNGWTTRDWKAKELKPVANRDLWEEIDKVMQTTKVCATIKWVKGHKDCEGNHLADANATIAVEELKLNYEQAEFV